MTGNNNKAKRRLSKFDFTGDEAHLALVSKEQGGAANGYSTLILKAASDKEIFTIEKMQTVMVEMELPDFLERFFYLYEEEAEVLAYLMGYQEAPETQDMENSEMLDKYQRWVRDNMSSIEVMKSLNVDCSKTLKELDSDTFVEVLKAKETIEPLIKGYSLGKERIEKNSKTKKHKKEETTMSVEMIEKSVLLDVQKHLVDQQVALQKANEMIEQFKKEKFENILKQRTQQIKSVVETDENVEKIIKHVGDIDDQKWEAIVDVMKAISSGEHKDEMFKEFGVSKSVSVDFNEQQQVLAQMIKEKFKV